MRALRACTAILLVAIAAAGGSRASATSPPSAADVCAEAGTQLTRVEPPPQPDTFLGSSPASVPGAVEEGGRTHVPATRTVRPHRPVRVVVPAARVAAVQRERLDYARVLDVARFGWFSFGSTAPPPFRA